MCSLFLLVSKAIPIILKFDLVSEYVVHVYKVFSMLNPLTLHHGVPDIFDIFIQKLSLENMLLLFHSHGQLHA